MVSNWQNDLKQGERFGFGANWSQYLAHIDENRIETAKQSLLNMLKTENLSGQSFLDIGCGSGLFSLAAVRLGAKVRSFDYDPDSVACACFLRGRFAPASDWDISGGSVLDSAFLGGLGRYDIVYSWGVLHHTGSMWNAIENATAMVARNGKLFLSIYHDSGLATRAWRAVKHTYVHSPPTLRKSIVYLALIRLWGPAVVRNLMSGRSTIAAWRNYDQNGRGMSAWTDVVDWVGGYPFEAAKPEQIVRFLARLGFACQTSRLRPRTGCCNEFIFTLREQDENGAELLHA